MASTSLQDCTKELRDAYIALKADYVAQNPGRSLVITCTERTPEEQAQLYALGRGKDERGVLVVQDPAQVVTYAAPGQSLHNCHPSQAIDVAIVIGGKITWKVEEYGVLGPLALKHGLEWGGFWIHFKDLPHLQKKAETASGVPNS